MNIQKDFTDREMIVKGKHVKNAGNRIKYLFLQGKP